ncbi:hypothetical protein SAMN04488007_2553 [Maribacter aquivivus]|uniref:Uncharacterized protein n=1 Tax=Maribacter aquivivus TaxID=228958 RepID=A0A1M6R0J5_9FLAO|nr:hypothetical protein [Maribacter aquivivus]SHK25954.1 hypothetical protein SAMN04488007_2553 [Maribacter aquivivus]
MKKVVSILAVAIMTIGMATSIIQNTASEFDFINDISKALTCDDCYMPPADRKPPKGIA